MIVAGTGHRPDKLHLTKHYSLDNHLKLTAYLKAGLPETGATEVISGMAMGFDLALAHAAIQLMLPLTAAIPFAGHELRWDDEWRKICSDARCMAANVVIVSDGEFETWKYQKRNEWMVDHCDKMLVMWDGSDGGTWNCLQYAEKKSKPYTNVMQGWVSCR